MKVLLSYESKFTLNCILTLRSIDVLWSKVQMVAVMWTALQFFLVENNHMQLADRLAMLSQYGS